MKVAVVIFPGSNCDHDALHVTGTVMGWDVVPVWHESASLGGADLVVLPGGFSYGDYLRCGAIARFSPIMAAVVKHAQNGGLTLGICNGFQVLLEAGLLPGALLRNNSLEFRCVWTHLKVQSMDSPFTQELDPAKLLRVPVAHGDGNYFAPPELSHQLNEQGRIAFRYCEEDGRITASANPNGSVENIAGIFNEGRNVLGMMPHPERASEAVLGSADGKSIFDSLAKSLAEVSW